MYILNVINAVRKEIKKLPSGLQAATLDGLEQLAKLGVELNEPTVRDLGRRGLKELRVHAQEGIARSLFFFERDKHIYVVLTYQKKTQKTPQAVLTLAEQRMKALKRSLDND